MPLHQPLASRHIALEPMTEAHREGLSAACAADPDTWLNLYPYSMDAEHFDPQWERLMGDFAAGRTLPFAALRGGEVVGMTCYITPSETDRSVEIGGTYYQPDARGGATNPACKRLLLAHAFDLGFNRLWFKVDAINLRSRAAVEKLGAIFEGVHRQDRITWTGRVRDTAFYSILTPEWPAVRERLDTRLAAFE